MRNLLKNIFYLAPQNNSLIVLWVAAGMWILTWLLLISDILSQERSSGWKVTWLVLGSIPIVGGILYALAELLTCDWGGLLRWRGITAKRKDAQKEKLRIN